MTPSNPRQEAAMSSDSALEPALPRRPGHGDTCECVNCTDGPFYRRTARKQAEAFVAGDADREPSMTPSNPASDRNEPQTEVGRELVPELTKAGVLFLLAHRKECPVPSITIREALVEIEAEATERAIGAGIDVEAILHLGLRFARMSRGGTGANFLDRYNAVRREFEKQAEACLARLTPQPASVEALGIIAPLDEMQEANREMEADLWNSDR